MSRRMARPRSAGPKLNVAWPCNAALVPFIEAKQVYAVLVAVSSSVFGVGVKSTGRVQGCLGPGMGRCRTTKPVVRITAPQSGAFSYQFSIA